MPTLFQSRVIMTTLIWVLVCLLLGSLVGILANSGNTQWYQSLNRPVFAPPSWLRGGGVYAAQWSSVEDCDFFGV